ncbi:hypothetical protein OCK02_07735 [Rhizobium sp. TRM96647]|uniref:hypothetical protein n=1 Tax=unclassified Rhizobium TaxID=2613769 RepID=UPI001E464269|nr:MULTISPECIES: hypothetical protein [unclassified Rhizobium]MCD2182937.1 hypothetical protein [Rhizobium sp. GN54]MCV3736092.1 hypothetical protein [Rhizobium sp. TRM96647]MCV3758246.1 hypothetical protein [Rhizobium sp. TRM96650]
MTVTKEDLFKPGQKMSAQAKADQTNATAREILAAETVAREKKTEKLRALRLAQSASEAPVAPKKGRRK